MADQTPVRAEVTVDLDALRHNVRVLRGRAPGSELMVAVKADGYGHGAVPVARAAVEAGATWLGACSQAEALVLREGGLTARVLAWLDVPETDLSPSVAAGVDVSVATPEAVDRLVAAGRRAGKTPRAHLKIDTGLCRNGCPRQLWPELVGRAAAAQRAGELVVVAVWSHLACADEPGHPSVDGQAERFACAYEQARAAGLDPARHLVNTAGLLTRPDLHFDVVRPGIGVYGLNPVPGDHTALRPAMSFRSSVALVKRVAAGESVSYGHTWTAAVETTLALVPVGYADGVPRGLSGKFEAWHGGSRKPVVGRVSMDQIVLDCGAAPVREGDEVVLFGDGSRGEPTATEWAELLGTIDYEIVTGMYRPRVVRRYVGTGP